MFEAKLLPNSAVFRIPVLALRQVSTNFSIKPLPEQYSVHSKVLAEIVEMFLFALKCEAIEKSKINFQDFSALCREFRFRFHRLKLQLRSGIFKTKSLQFMLGFTDCHEIVQHFAKYCTNECSKLDSVRSRSRNYVGSHYFFPFDRSKKTIRIQDFKWWRNHNINQFSSIECALFKSWQSFPFFKCDW
jgi:hypothetical protein